MFIIDDLAIAAAVTAAIGFIEVGLPIIAAAGAAIGIYNLGSNALNAYEIELLKAEDELIKTTMMRQDSLYRNALIEIETTRSQDMQNISQENLFRDSIISDNQIKIDNLIQQDLINQANIQLNYDMNIMNNESIQNLGLYDQLLNQNDINLNQQQNLLIQNYEIAIPNLQTNLQTVNDNLSSQIIEGNIYNATQFSRIDNINTDQEYRINILETQAQENPIMKEEDLRIILNQTVTQPLLEQVPIQTTELLKPELSQLEIQVQNHQQKLTKQIEDQQNASFGRFDTFNQELSNFANTVPIATNEILHPNFVRINTDLANQNSRIRNIPSTTIDLIDPKINTITENIQGELATINQNVTNNNANTGLIIGAIGVVGTAVAVNKGMLTGLTTSVANLGTNMSNLFRKLGIDRMLNMLNTGLLLHNAMMLSNNLAQSLLYIIDNVINFIGFQATDAEGNAITASQVLGGTIQNFIIGMIGEEAYINARIELNKANRIYQAATNVAYTVVSFADIIKEISEIIVENTGKIGNALRRSGAVLENSYNIMPERNGIKTAMQKKLERFNEGLQELTEGAETFVELTELLVEGKENIRELTTGMGEFDKSLQEQEDEKEALRMKLKTEARSYTDITSVNFVKQPPEGN